MPRNRTSLGTGIQRERDREGKKTENDIQNRDPAENMMAATIHFNQALLTANIAESSKLASQ